MDSHSQSKKVQVHLEALVLFELVLRLEEGMLNWRWCCTAWNHLEVVGTRNVPSAERPVAPSS